MKPHQASNGQRKEEDVQLQSPPSPIIHLATLPLPRPHQKCSHMVSYTWFIQSTASSFMQKVISFMLYARVSRRTRKLEINFCLIRHKRDYRIYQLYDVQNLPKQLWMKHEAVQPIPPSFLPSPPPKKKDGNEQTENATLKILKIQDLTPE